MKTKLTTISQQKISCAFQFPAEQTKVFTCRIYLSFKTRVCLDTRSTREKDLHDKATPSQAKTLVSRLNTKPFLCEKEFYCIRTLKNRFHINSFPFSLALKQRLGATWKQPIRWLFIKYDKPGVHNPARETSTYSRHSVFTGQFIFRTIMRESRTSFIPHKPVSKNLQSYKQYL